MTWPGVDYHSHICASPIDAMVSSARERGVREYGISEHIYQLDEGFQIFPEIASEGDRFPRSWYVETVRERAADSLVEIRLGLEVDFVPGYDVQVAAVLAGVEWDYLIGSIHEIDGIDLFSYRPVDRVEGQRLWARYYELSVAAVESGLYDVLSHPVRNMVLNPFVPDDISDLLQHLAESAASNGVSLELNGEDTRNWPELVALLAKAASRAGATISLGSDAHRPATVAQSLRVASDIAVTAGLAGVASFQRRDRRIVPFA